MQIEVDKYGFPLETHPELRPVESATSGIFISGCARTPMDIQSTMAQARSAAKRALEVLTQMAQARDSAKEKVEEYKPDLPH